MSDNSQSSTTEMSEMAEAQKLEIRKLVADTNILTERAAFTRAILATFMFIAIWKTCISMGIHTWGGGAFNGALMALFPTVYDWRSYAFTKKCNPLAGQALMAVIVLAVAILFNLSIDALHIPQ